MSRSDDFVAFSRPGDAHRLHGVAAEVDHVYVAELIVAEQRVRQSRDGAVRAGSHGCTQGDACRVLSPTVCGLTGYGSDATSGVRFDMTGFPCEFGPHSRLRSTRSLVLLAVGVLYACCSTAEGIRDVPGCRRHKYVSFCGSPGAMANLSEDDAGLAKLVLKVRARCRSCRRIRGLLGPHVGCCC